MVAARVILTPELRESLDHAVRLAIAANPGQRAAQLLSDHGIQLALGKLPPGRGDCRYLDSSLQRLKQAGKIRTGRERGQTNKWFPESRT